MPPAAGLLQEGLPPKRLSGHRLGCAGQATARYRDVFGRRTDIFQVAAGVPTGLGHHVRLPTHVGMAEGLAPRRGRGGRGSGTASDVGVRPGHGSRPPRSREPSAAGLHGPAPPRLWPALCSAPQCGLASAHPRWPNARGACPRPAPRNRVARHTAARMFTGSLSTSREGTVCHSPSVVSATRGPSIVLGSSGNATRPTLTEEALADPRLARPDLAHQARLLKDPRSGQRAARVVLPVTGGAAPPDRARWRPGRGLDPTGLPSGSDAQAPAAWQRGPSVPPRIRRGPLARACCSGAWSPLPGKVPAGWPRSCWLFTPHPWLGRPVLSPLVWPLSLVSALAPGPEEEGAVTLPAADASGSSAPPAPPPQP